MMMLRDPYPLYFGRIKVPPDKPDACLSLMTAAAGDDRPTKKTRAHRDPMSHRIIEKRRRDRMNNCLADLSKLIPTTFLKQGRIEKTEIIEMAIKQIKQLMLISNERKAGRCCAGRFCAGYRSCMEEMMRHLLDVRGLEATDPLCAQLYAHVNQQLLKQKCQLSPAATAAALQTPPQASSSSSTPPSSSSSPASSGSDSSSPMVTNSSNSPSPSSGSSSSPPSAIDLSLSASGELDKADSEVPYHFKKNIKHRFASASENVSSSGDKSGGSSGHGEEKTIPTLPGFALHPNGLFYVPVQVPFCQLERSSQRFDPSQPFPLHPLNIPIELTPRNLGMHTIAARLTQPKTENFFK